MLQEESKPALCEFRCETPGCKAKGNCWTKRATECKCRICKELAKPIPEREGVRVYIFEFWCAKLDCANKYTVVCRLQDGAVCYECRKLNKPHHAVPRDFIDRKKDSRHVHSCARCRNGEINPCPNITAFWRSRRPRSSGCKKLAQNVAARPASA